MTKPSNIGRQALRAAFYATRNLAGLTGALSCNRFGDCADPNIVVNQIQDGAFVPVYRVRGAIGHIFAVAPHTDKFVTEWFFKKVF